MPFSVKCTEMDTLTSEGATILLGVLLADMTGTMLKLDGVAGVSTSCYYPAAFVNEVLRCAMAEEMMLGGICPCVVAKARTVTCVFGWATAKHAERLSDRLGQELRRSHEGVE